MIPPVRCFTCGKVLGDKWDFYQKEKTRMEQEAAKAPPSKPTSKGRAYFDPVATGPILDALGLTRYCCRRHLLTDMDMTDDVA